MTCKKHYPVFCLLGFILIVFLLLFFFLKTSIWDGKGKITLAVNRQDDVLVSVFDPKRKTIVSVSVPQSVQIVAAGELGTWKLGSIWQLGHNEKKEGDLLAKTVTKNFGFPVYVWADSAGAGFADGRFGKIWLATVGRYKTSIKIGDRLRLGLFALKVGPAGRTIISLEDFGESLKKETFLDGSPGFVMKGDVPDRIIAFFADEAVAAKNYKAKFILRTERVKSIDAVSRVIENMGVKVASVIKETPEDIDCRIAGEDITFTKSVALVLGCTGREKKTVGGNFEIEVTFGERFNNIF